ncbi:LuxR C-terminal-related transcriptional regulator [Nocardia tengchongensis]|uniref:helix-turn-helix transcriptional regulator n=1 Tax=Nocardia tengchongensis TaxID=2055889 RepID=UPI0036C5ADB5
MSTAGQHHIPSDARPATPATAGPDLAFPTLPRTHLLRTLDTAADTGHTILLNAPAGTGKTVLLATWLDHRRTTRPGTRTAWGTADAHNSGTPWADLHRDLITPAAAGPEGPHRPGPALRAVPTPPSGQRDPRPGRRPADRSAHRSNAVVPHGHVRSVPSVGPAEGDDVGFGSSLTRLLDELCAESAPVVLVIDAAEDLVEPQLSAELEYLVRHAPANVTVVVAGRVEPALRWHALELRGRLARFGPAELALTAEEVRELCDQHGCALDGRMLARVLELTRGWAALARLAALHLARQPRDPGTALATLARSPRTISAFLEREVIGPLPAQVREFLVRTALPAAFTEQLAERLVEHSPRETLDTLARLHFPYTHENRDGALCFAYPPLVRAHLLGETLRMDPAALTRLRLTIADWNIGAGVPLSALEQLLYLPDPGPARDFLRDHALGVVLDGGGPALFDRLDHAIPAFTADPYIRLLRAVDALGRGEIDTATAQLELTHPARDDSAPTGDPEPRPGVQLRQPTPIMDSPLPESVSHPSGARSCVPEQWLRTLRRAVAIELAIAVGGPAEDLEPGPEPTPTGNHDIDAYLAVQRATVLLGRGEVATGERELRRTLASAEHSRHARLALRSANRLAVASGIEGSIAALRERAQHALDIAGAHRLLDSTDALQAVVMTALAAHVQGDDHSGRYFADALTGHRRRGAFEPGSHEHVVAQLLAFDTAADRYGAAQSLRHSMSVLINRSQPPFTLGLLVQAVWTLLRVPDGRAAQQLVAEAHRTVGAHPVVALCEAGLARAANKARSVHALTAPLLAAGARVNPLMAVLGWLLDATAHAELGNSLKAYEGLANALRCAEPEHLVRPFLDVPGALDLLDTFAGRFGHDDAFAGRIRHHPAAARGSAAAPALTTTELTVLKHLPSGRTTQQIADDLGVSINTVKTHMRGIYGKLGSSSRTDALDRARRTGLL